MLGDCGVCDDPRDCEACRDGFNALACPDCGEDARDDCVCEEYDPFDPADPDRSGYPFD